MAQRLKTVEYAFPSRNTSLASATRYDFSAITLYIPETGSRTFRSVIVEVTCRDTATSATSLTSPLVGVKLGAAAFGDTTLGNPPGNSGESVSYIFVRDATAYFVSNFGAGSSQTCQVGVNFTGPATINISAKLYITYEYDDTASTHVKTARIPLESGTAALTATLAEIGTNQIPNLSTFLPEASKTFRNIWFELTYNEFTVGTTNDASLGMQVDSGTEHLTGIHESGLASACNNRYIWDQGASPVWSTSAVHAFKLRSSNITTASTFNHVAVLLCVTYEFNVASTTDTIKSLVYAAGSVLSAGHTASTDAASEDVDILVMEPGTITLQQSGVLVAYSNAAGVDPVVAFGVQSFRTYADDSVQYCGAAFFMQRIDSGSAAGAAFASFGRGVNNLRSRVYCGTSGIVPAGFSGLIYLNYVSPKSTQGVGAEAHSTAWIIQQSQASGQTGNFTAATTINIPESNWMRASLVYVVQQMTTCQPEFGVRVQAEAASDELGGVGFYTLGDAYATSDSELGWYPSYLPAQAIGPGIWARQSGDFETLRMDLEQSRRWKVISLAAGTRALWVWFTYHSITFSVGGTVSGSGGGTVLLKTHRASDGVKLAETSRVGNGAYSTTVFENTSNCYTEAYEGSAYLGRSDNGIPTGNP